MKRRSPLSVFVTVLTIFWLAAGPASAVVRDIDANVTAQVREIIDGQVANTDFAFEELDETTGNLPLSVTTDFQQFNNAQEQIAGALAITTFNDPRVSAEPDPDEFGVDLAVFSRADAFAYDGFCQAQEIRQITFTTEDVDAAAGTPLLAQSTFFVDGQIFLWAEDGGTDLTGTSAEVQFQVSQTRPGLAPAVVMSATLTLVGQADGSVLLTATGDLQPGNVVLVDLTGTVPELGAVHMLVIPNLAIPYDYNASVEEDFQLTAQVDAEVANEPGTGVSVVLGLPLDELVALIDEVVPEDAREEIADALEEAVMNAPDPEVPLEGGDGSVQVLFCGLFGAESAMMLMIMATALCVRHHRRWRA